MSDVLGIGKLCPVYGDDFFVKRRFSIKNMSLFPEMRFSWQNNAPAATSQIKKTSLYSELSFWAKKTPAAISRPKRNVIFKNTFFWRETKAPAATSRPNEKMLSKIRFSPTKRRLRPAHGPQKIGNNHKRIVKNNHADSSRIAESGILKGFWKKHIKSSDISQEKNRANSIVFFAWTFTKCDFQ